MLVAAAFYTAADDDLDFLTAYARAGGHLVVGPRTGYGDTEARARTERAPARIADAAGAWYDEMISLPAPVPVAGSLRGAATGFAEGLVATDAEVLAAYQHRHLGRWAVVTTRAAGAGRITVVGTVPDQDLAAALVRWLVPDAVGGWTAGDSVTVSTSTDPSGAALPNVNIQITNNATQRVFTTKTGADGGFVAPNLEPGHYRLRFEHAGFNQRDPSAASISFRFHIRSLRRAKNTYIWKPRRGPVDERGSAEECPQRVAGDGDGHTSRDG